MGLEIDFKNELENAIKNYSFPAVVYDFECKREINANSMLEVESYIKSKLTSNMIQEVKDGLSNVLYWGYANIGYGCKRIDNFRNNVLDKQIEDFKRLNNNNNIDLIKVKNLNMPEYSGVSFISKIMMFLDPNNYCVLDKQIAKISICTKVGALGKLKYKGETQVRVTRENQDAYEKWCEECKLISKDIFKNKYRAVDIERGFFVLVQKDSCLAKEIYENIVIHLQRDMVK
ncbi:MAG: hypothetical protein IJR50_07515 [Treponema sp.]|nr:hypothetical protein [Treponema sp.]